MRAGASTPANPKGWGDGPTAVGTEGQVELGWESHRWLNCLVPDPVLTTTNHSCSLCLAAWRVSRRTC